MRTTRHVQADLIHEWAEEGFDVQYRPPLNPKWLDCGWNPSWDEDFEYRRKPREFKEGAWYPTITKHGCKTVRCFKRGGFFSDNQTLSGPFLCHFKWIGEEIEVKFPAV